ncbi:MAG TPA: glycosyltransferase family 4 protein [Vicinamibacterales bacterium]|nr:glycosyltransferase family 4 protein [Vicinamibacterales bacterium]
MSALAAHEPLRILVAHQVPAARNGGMSRIMGFIHDRLVERGHHVDYYTADDVPVRWRTAFGRRFAFPLLVSRAAIDAARAGNPYDIVNVHEPHALPLILQRVRAGSPAVVVTSHGLERRAWQMAKDEARLGRGTLSARTRLTYPVSSLWPTDLGLRGADHVFCLNADDQHYLERRLGRRPDTVTRIFPAADLVYWCQDRDYDGSTRMLFAAAWRENKGIADLVPAFIRLAMRHPSLMLHVIGAGVPDTTVRAAFPAALASRIVCETPAREADTAAAFAGAHAFLLPSLFEGTPLTLMQAMMSGLPIVTTATCGMKDVIQDGVSGLLVPIRSPDAIVEAVERLLGDRSLRMCLGRGAQADAIARFTWARVADPVEDVYARLRDGSLAR